MERLGVQAVGLHGSLASAAILADTLDRATFPGLGSAGCSCRAWKIRSLQPGQK